MKGNSRGSIHPGSSVARALSLAGFFLLFTGVRAANAQRLAVVSRGEDVVAFVDLVTGRISGQAPTGSFPHEITSDPLRRFAFVPSYGGDEVAKVDLHAEETTARFHLEGHSALHSAVWLAGIVWVTAEESAGLLGLDPESGQIVAQKPTRGYRSHMVAAAPSIDRMYVANIDSGFVSVMNSSEGLLTHIRTGAGAEGIDVSPDGSEVWVSNREDDSISVIDTKSESLVDGFSSGGSFPVKLKFRPDGRQVWVSNNRSGTVSVFDAATRELIDLVEVGSRPLGIAFSDDSETAWITRPGADEIVEIRTSAFIRITRRIAGPPSPDGVLYLPE